VRDVTRRNSTAAGTNGSRNFIRRSSANVLAGVVCAMALVLGGAGARAEEAQLDPKPVFKVQHDGDVKVTTGGVELRVGLNGAVQFAPAGADLNGPTSVRFDLLSLERGDSTTPLAPAKSYNLESAERVTLDRGDGVTEIYEPRRLGVEQLFRIDSAPKAEGDVVLTARLHTELAVIQPKSGAGLSFLHGAEQVLSYGEVVAIDANGDRVDCPIELAGQFLRIVIPAKWAATAVWPVVVDPLVGSDLALAGTSSREHRTDSAFSVTSNSWIVTWDATTSISGLSERNVEMIRYNVTGTASATPSTIGSKTTVTVTANDESDPKVAWLGGSANRFLVVWLDRSIGQIRGALVHPTATTTPVSFITIPIAVTDTTFVEIRDLDVGGRQDGGSWLVVYEAFFTPTDTDILGVLVTPTGGPDLVTVGTAFVIYGSGDDDRHPAVNKLAGPGQPWMTASSRELFAAPGADFDVRCSTVSSSGVTGSFFNVIPSVDQVEDRPSVDGFGPEWLVALESKADDGAIDSDLLATRVTSSGVTGSFASVAVSLTLDDRRPSVAATTNDYLVSWLRLNSPSGVTGSALFSRFDASNLSFREADQPFGTANRSVEVASCGHPITPATTADYLVSWSHLFSASGDPITGDYDTKARRVNANLDPAIVVRESTTSGTIVANNAISGGIRNFGRRNPNDGASNAITIVVQNTGGANLILTTPVLGNTTDFVLGTPGFTTTVAPGANTTFTASFDPASAGVKTSTVTFNFSGGSILSTPFTVNLSGEGVDGLVQIVSATSLPITDLSAVTVTSSIVVSTPGVVSNVRVANVNILHTWVGDLRLELISPTGARVLLAQLNSLNSSDNYSGTTFDDAAAAAIPLGDTSTRNGTFKPQGVALATLNGTVAAGTWTLSVTDIAGSDGGTFQGWTLELITTLDPALTVREGSLAGASLTDNAVVGGLRNLGRIDPAAGAGNSVTFFLSNTGLGNLTLTTPQITPATDFTLSTAGFLTTVVAGASTSVTATFDPNSAGTKTAQISFDFSGGSIPSTPFRINLSGEGVNGLITPSNTTPSTISDAPAPATLSTIVVAQAGSVASVKVVNMNITHSFNSDLDIFLISPSGTRVELATDLSGSNYVNTTFDQSAPSSIASGSAPYTGSFRPEGTVTTLASLVGEVATGTWTLEITDDLSGGAGVLTSWGLEIVISPDPAIGVREGSATGPVIANGAAVTGGRQMGFAVIGATPTAFTVSVTNNGLGTLTLGTPTTTTSDFRVDTTLTTLSLSQGQSSSFAVQFVPQSTGVKTDTISFTHNGSNTTTPFTITVTGEGLATPPSSASIAATGLPLAIPDLSPTGVSSSLFCTQGGTVLSVSVSALNITHTFNGDLRIRLIAPDLTTVTLSAKRGVSSNGFSGVVFDDLAPTPVSAMSTAAIVITGSFSPDQPLATFKGVTAFGNWTLFIVDDGSGDFGTLDGWSLNVLTTAGPTPTPLMTVRLTSATGTAIASNDPATGARNFGQVVAGSSATPLTIVVQNTGTGDLSLSNLALASGSTEFSFNAPGFATPLPAGQNRSFTIDFNPIGASGARSAIFSFDNNGFGATSPFLINVTGEAVAVLGPTFTSVDVPKAIPDLATTLSTLNVGGATRFVTDVNVQFTMTHTFPSDIEATLISPQGTRVLLIDFPALNGADNFTNTVLDDSGTLFVHQGTAPYTGTFRPIQPLSIYNNTNPVGTWTLELKDVGSGDVGTLLAWSLEIATTTTAQPTLFVAEGAAPLANNAAVGGGRSFGTRGVTQGPSGTITINISNPGGANLDLGTPALGGTNAGDFVLSGITGFPTVAPAGTASFQLAFAPSSVGPKLATVTFTSNTAGSPFVINLSGLGAAQPVTTANATGLPVRVPPGTATAGTTTHTITVAPGAGFIVDVNTGFSIQHTSAFDLDITLVSPAGTRVDLILGRGGFNPNFTNTVLDDQAATPISAGSVPFTGSFRPESPLAALFNQDASGIWTLEVVDAAAGDFGNLNAWFLEIVTSATPAGIIEVTQQGVAGALPNPATGTSAFDFGLSGINPAIPATKTIVIRNTAAGAMTVSALTVIGAGATEYSLVNATLPIALAQNVSTTVVVSYDPSTAGAHAAQVSIEHDSPITGSPFLIDLRGSAVAGLVSTSSTAVPVAAADALVAGAGSTPQTTTTTMTIATTASIALVSTTISMTHSFVGDMEFNLSHPDGTTVQLVNRRGGSDDNFTGTIFDDSATLAISAGTAPFTGKHNPEVALTAFNGKPANGVWSLSMTDHSAGGAGTLTAWTLDIGTAPIPLIEVRDGSVAGTTLTAGAAASGNFAFGDRQVSGVTAGATIFVRNTGTATLNLSSLQIAGNAAFTLNPGTFAASNLAAGQSTTVDVVFNPAAVAANLVNTAITATAQFAHTDTTKTSPFVVNVSGRATAGVITVTDGATTLASGATVDLGSQAVTGGPTAARVITVQNTGLAAVTVSAFTASGNLSEFGTTTSTALPATLAAGQSFTISVTFDPNTAGARSATIVFTHGGLSTGAASPFTLNIAGTGINSIVTNPGGSGSSGGGGGGGCSAGGQVDTSTPVLLGALLTLWAASRARRRKVAEARA